MKQADRRTTPPAGSRAVIERDIALRREAFGAQCARLDTLRTMRANNDRLAARMAARGRR